MFAQRFWNNRLIGFLALTLAFGSVYSINHVLTAPLMVVPGAHLIHLPSGIKFLLVLIFGWTGAFSIFTVSLLAGLFFYFPDQWLVSLMLATSCALAPLLTRKMALFHLNIDRNLNHLSFKQLLVMGLIYSVLNSSLNQLVLYWQQIITDFLDGLLVMFTGDITGVAMIIGILKLSLRLFNPHLNDGS
jgi:hypothetical protein